MREDRSLFVPTAPTDDSSKQIANTEYVQQELTGVTDFISGIVQSPSVQDYRLALNLPVAVTFTRLIGQLITGTLTVKLQISDSDVPGSTINVTTAQISAILTTGNTAAVGSYIDLNVTTTGGPATFMFMVWFTRAL